MKKGVTIKDIAKKLNMSVSTVSKALSNDASISTLTKERVNQLADEWNYVPNEAARHFKLNKSFTIGLIIPDLLDQFYILAINGVEAVAEKEKYNVILSQSHEDVVNEEKIANLMIRNRVDGVIVAITKNTVDMILFQKLMALGIPVVCIARAPKNHSFNYVSSNNYEGAYKATEFLVKKDHQRIAYISGPQSMQICQMRLQGYEQALLDYAVPVSHDLIKVTDLTEVSIAKAMRELMKLKSPPTGIFTFKNYITLHAIDFLKKKYPDKVNKIDFVGFGNLPLLQYLDSKPTASIEENSYEMGKEAATLLFKMISEQNEKQTETLVHIQIPCRLVVHK